MKILTVVTHALDAEETVRVRDGRVDVSADRLGLDRMDEYGVEEALRLREAGMQAEIVAVGIGTANRHSAVRAALVMGVDRGIYLASGQDMDAMSAGIAIAEVARQEGADIVFAGGQQANSDSQALGGTIAEALGWPQVTWVSELKFDAGLLSGTHDTDTGSESFEVALPVVITTQQGLNEPRYPTVPNIRKSKTKELREQTNERIGDLSKVRTLSSALATRERSHTVIDGRDPAAAASRLVDFLRNEAKVVP